MTPWVVVTVAVLAVSTQAGEIAVSPWPGGCVPQEVTTIPVLMDIPWWVRIENLDELVIHLVAQSAYEYEGCLDVVFEASGNLDISARFIPNGAVAGRYSCWLSSSVLRTGENVLNVCVNLEVPKLPTPMTNVQVGVVVFRIAPRG